MTQKKIHEDIPLERAWQTGRRIYVRCGYNSQLNKQLLQLGSTWDGDVRARWVGSTKKTAVVELVRAHLERIAAIERVKAEGRWVAIPYEATDIRARAAALDGVWDDGRKQWAMRAEEHQAEIIELVQTYQAEIDRQQAEQRAALKRDRQIAEQANKKRDQERAEAEAATRRERILTESGRTPTGETDKLTIISTRYMNRAGALQMAHQLGDVVRFDDDRRGVVVSVKAWFTDEEIASSICWHAQTHDEAHWDIEHTVAIVEPTEEEKTADAERAAVRRDALEIHDLIQHISRATQPLTPDEWATIGNVATVGEISETYGSTYNRGTTLKLTRDGRAYWTHPGYHDDYISTGGSTSDPETVARLRAILNVGPRTREVIDQMLHTYKVKPE
ncbi:hypothetical protein ACQP2T_61860 [Nonomuraea sp. CA-143628]|uniref:hypothetical protein n=1 Tax=Nonomuraea sp. CA-143628 TaxID=3239997 RepID=UPI003D943937